MEVSNKSFQQRFLWLWRILRHGLFFHGLRNRLAGIGIDFMPYYWVKEEVSPIVAPKIKGNSEDYTISFFGEKEIEIISKSVKGTDYKDLKQYLDDGQWCIGVKKNDEIAAYMLVQFEDIHFRGKTIRLYSDEAYLREMYTFESYRGKNIAPFLRYHCYELLREKSIVNKFSITEYFNKSSIRFKRKLNSKHLSLWLSIRLFRKYCWNFRLCDYKNPELVLKN